jgi:integrase
MKRPKPIHLAWARASVVRGPREDLRWYWRVRAQGSRKVITTQWWTANEAAVAVGALVASNPAPPREPQEGGAPRTVAELLDLWVEHQVRRHSAGRIGDVSLNRYRNTAAHWKATAIATVRPQDLTVSEVDDALLVWLQSDVSARTVFTNAVRLKAVAAWGSRRGWCASLDTLTPPRPTEQDRVYRTFTPSGEEMARVIQALPEGEIKDAVRLQMMTGARNGEISALKVGDYDRASQSLRLSGRDDALKRRGKTGIRDVPVADPALSALLHRLTEGRDPDERLVPLSSFNSRCNKALKKACAAAGVPVFSTHAIRRLAVQVLLDSGMNPKEVSLITGHSVTTMLRAYVRPSPERLRAKMSRAGLGNPSSRGRVLAFRAQDSGTTSESGGQT